MPTQDDAPFVVLFYEPLYCCEGCSKKFLNSEGSAISRMNPNEFRRGSQEQTSFFQVRILGNDGQTLFFGVLPNSFVRGAAETPLVHMRRTGIKIRQAIDEFGRKVLVEEQLHAFRISTLRSRSAANARQARITCSVRYGKACKISS
jgi:hypothetical protein